MTWSEITGGHVFALSGPNRGLMLSFWFNGLLALVAVAAMPFDRRTILGLNPWIKPLKFDLSVMIFLLTMAVLLSALGRLGAVPVLRVWLSWGMGVGLAVENAIISLQSARGVRSHMNFSSTLDALLFAAMGLLIAGVTVLVAVLLASFLVVRTGLPAALTCGIVLGLVVLLAGSAEGVVMVGKYQAHTVGAADGGAGLPFVNWSTGHGDLRVAHFFALHALQAFMLAGWAASRMRVGSLAQVGVVVVLAVVYSGGVWWLFREAVAGRPVLG